MAASRRETVWSSTRRRSPRPVALPAVPSCRCFSASTADMVPITSSSERVAGSRCVTSLERVPYNTITIHTPNTGQKKKKVLQTSFLLSLFFPSPALTLIVSRRVLNAASSGPTRSEYRLVRKD